ncbi:MAG: response regulator [Spirochaetota bacterium]
MDKNSINILIVEDEPNNLLLIVKLLQIEGIDKNRILTTDKDPIDIISKADKNIDLVFLDIHLPKKDGYEILKDLRNNESTKKAVIIALTASVMNQDIEKAKAAGFDGFIGKPIDGRHFSQTFNFILEGKSVWSVGG